MDRTKANTNITPQFCSLVQKQAFAEDPGIAQLIQIAIWKVLIHGGHKQAALLRLSAYAALGETIYSDNHVLQDPAEVSFQLKSGLIYIALTATLWWKCFSSFYSRLCPCLMTFPDLKR